MENLRQLFVNGKATTLFFTDSTDLICEWFNNPLSSNIEDHIPFLNEAWSCYAIKGSENTITISGSYGDIVELVLEKVSSVKICLNSLI